jgi:phenylacetate-CoA ligase
MRENDQPLTESARFPLLTETGRALMRGLHEHPAAPRFNFPCGERLTAGDLAHIRAFESRLAAEPFCWAPRVPPAWAWELVDRCSRTVPFYRKHVPARAEWSALPTCDRQDVARAPWAFVAHEQPLEGLCRFFTSGTTGTRMDVLSHPVPTALYLPLLRRALGRVGVSIGGESDRVAIVNVCAQASVFTHVTVSSVLSGAGYVKVNLNPHDWANPDHRVEYLDFCRPELFSGDPFSLLALAELPLTTRPHALVSSATTLLPGVRAFLERRFGCPVLDLYSMTECRAIAFSAGDESFELLSDDVYVEILDRVGNPCGADEAGEIVVTSDRNPFLPLIRYRTGDTGVWAEGTDRPRIKHFSGRAPVVFVTCDSRLVNSIDVTEVLKPLPMARFSLRQQTDRSLVFCWVGERAGEDAVRQALRRVFPAEQPLSLEHQTADVNGSGRKVIEFGTELSPGEYLENPGRILWLNR